MAFSPRVVGSHRPEYHSLESILSFPAFAGKKGEDLVLALYDFFTSTIDGTYHFWPADEKRGQPRIRRTTSDAVKLLNCYGWHICGQNSIIQYALYKTAGLEARQFNIPAHVLCEVNYDDAWHVLDVDMWTWFRNKNGQIASAFELATDAQALIVENQDKSDPCNLPDRNLQDYANTYASAQTDGDQVKNIFPHWLVSSHQMDFHLRPGERVTLSECPKGSFIFPDAWKSSVAENGKEWHGFPRERFEPFRSYGNGEWVYEPKLSAAYGDVTDGCWEQSGVQQTEAGIEGAGNLSFRIQSPYIFAAKPRLENDAISYVDGAKLVIESSGALKVHLKLEEQEMCIAEITDSGVASLDLTEQMTERYEGIIAFELSAGAVLKSLSFKSPIMTAPKSLPRLDAGDNQLQICSNDKYKRQTVPWKQIVDFTPQSDPLASSVRDLNARVDSWASNWKCLSPIEDSALEVVYEFEAPTQRQFSWFHALCSVKEATEGVLDQAASLAWSTDLKQWNLIKRSHISATHLQWDMSVEGDVLLDSTHQKIYLRVVSDTAITGIEFYGHLDASDMTSSQYTVEHQWLENGEPRSFICADLQPYTVHCDEQPSEHHIIFSADSRLM